MKFAFRGMSFLIIFVISANCIPLAGLGPSSYSRKVKNSKNTYFKFKLENYLNKDISGGASFYSSDNKYYFLVNFHDPEATFYYPINPSDEYYVKKGDGLYRSKFMQASGGDRRNFFLVGCEYWMPAPAGANAFTIVSNYPDDQRRETITQSFDLVENHSVRIRLNPILITEEKETPLSQAMNPRAGKREFYISERKGFKFDFQIEPNRVGEEEPKCNAPNADQDPSKK